LRAHPGCADLSAMRSHSSWIVLVLALAGILLWRESGSGWPRGVDRGFAAWLARASAPPTREPAVTLIGFDDATPGSAATGTQVPFGQPVDYALFLKSLLPCAPAVAVIEPVLVWNGPSPANLLMLEDYSRRTPKLMVGTELGRTTDPDEDNPRLPVVGAVRGDPSRVPEFTAVSLRPAESLREIGNAAVLNLPDPGEAHRGWIPLVVRYRGDLVPTLPLLAAMHWARATTRELSVDLGHEIRVGSTLRIPIDLTGAGLIAPGAITGVRRIAYADLLVRAETSPGNATTAGDVVLLGRVPAEAGVSDGGFGASRAELYARAIAAIQTGSVVRELPGRWRAVPALALAACGAALFLFPRPSALLAALGMAAAYAMIARGMVSAHGLALPAVVPAGMLLLMLLLRLVIRRPAKPPAEP